MSTTENSRVLSPADAVTLGELCIAVQARSKITYLPEQPRWNGPPVEGELRGFVAGKSNFNFLPWGVDVRDAYVWITAGGFERTERVEWLTRMLAEGGCIFEHRKVGV